MNKDKKKIKGLVQESLAGLFEKSKKAKMKKKPNSKVEKEDAIDVEKSKDAEEKEKEEKKARVNPEKALDNQDQTSIQNALDKNKNPLAPAISQVMHKVTGESPDNATARSEFLKKVKQKHGLGLTKDEKSRTEVELGLK